MISYSISGQSSLKSLCDPFAGQSTMRYHGLDNKGLDSPRRNRLSDYAQEVHKREEEEGEEEELGSDRSIRSERIKHGKSCWTVKDIYG